MPYSCRARLWACSISSRARSASPNCQQSELREQPLHYGRKSRTPPFATSFATWRIVHMGQEKNEMYARAPANAPWCMLTCPSKNVGKRRCRERMDRRPCFCEVGLCSLSSAARMLAAGKTGREIGPDKRESARQGHRHRRRSRLSASATASFVSSAVGPREKSQRKAVIGLQLNPALTRDLRDLDPVGLPPAPRATPAPRRSPASPASAKSLPTSGASTAWASTCRQVNW